MDEAIKIEEDTVKEYELRWPEDELDENEDEQFVTEWARSFSPTAVDELLLEGADREEAYFAMMDEMSDYLMER